MLQELLSRATKRRVQGHRTRIKKNSFIEQAAFLSAYITYFLNCYCMSKKIRKIFPYTFELEHVTVFFESHSVRTAMLLMNFCTLCFSDSLSILKYVVFRSSTSK
jgi:hypothetical protein